MGRSAGMFFAIAAVFFAAGDARADDDVGRYQLEPLRDGFVRLDTKTGKISHCYKKIVGWVCDDAKDGPRAGKRDEAKRDERFREDERDKDRRDDGNRDKGERDERERDDARRDDGKDKKPEVRSAYRGDARRLRKENRALRDETATLRRDFDRLKRDSERLRAENEELRAMIEGDGKDEDDWRTRRDRRRDGPRMEFREPPAEPREEIEPRDEGSDAPRSDMPLGPVPKEAERDKAERGVPPLADKRKDAPGGEGSPDTDDMHALIDRMIERFRDMVRELQDKPQDQSL